jgi:hypothetical protein
MAPIAITLVLWIRRTRLIIRYSFVCPFADDQIARRLRAPWRSVGVSPLVGLNAAHDTSGLTPTVRPNGVGILVGRGWANNARRWKGGRRDGTQRQAMGEEKRYNGFFFPLPRATRTCHELRRMATGTKQGNARTNDNFRRSTHEPVYSEAVRTGGRRGPFR